VNSRQALAESRKLLEDKGIEDASLEGEILLRFVVGMDRAALFASLDTELTPAQSAQLTALVERRLHGEPSAYITGHKEFYGLDFRVDRRVLIPRPETEILMEKALDFCRQIKCKTIADIGTGSGCIAISLAKNLMGMTVYAVDYSQDALDSARANAQTHGVLPRIQFLQGNLLEPLHEPVDVITANLPYVKQEEVNTGFEPQLALDGGADGLDKIKQLIAQVPGKLKPGGLLLLEVGIGQAEAVETNLHKVVPTGVTGITNDLAGIGRVVSLRLTP
jgi:release factor glutamine methyltransferase